MGGRDCADEANDERTQATPLPQDAPIIQMRSMKQISPLLRLPYELILHITMIAMECPRNLMQLKIGDDITWELADQRQSFHRLKMINRMAHISSTWRYVCLNATTLWNAIDLLWPSAAVESFAARAQQTPLLVNLNVHWKYQDEFHPSITDPLEFWNTQIAFWTQFISRNMHRVQSLEIRLDVLEPEGIFPEFWDAIRQLKAPILDKFSLCFPLWDEDVRVHNYVHDLFAHDAPRLKELSLEGLRFSDLDPTSFHTLVRLSITIGDFDPADVERLPSVLSALPNVETLKITVSGFYSPLVSSLTPSLYPAVSLCHCVELSLQHICMDSIIFIFSTVSFPSLSVLNLTTFMPRDASPDAIRELYTSIPQSLKQSSFMHEHMRMTFEPDYLSLEAGSHSTHNIILRHNIPDQPGAEGRDSCLIETCTAPFRVLNLRPVWLCVDGEPFQLTWEEILTKDLWCAILSHALSLEVLEVAKQFPFDYLCEALEDPRSLCPSLKELRRIGQKWDREAFDMMLERRKGQGLNNEIVLTTAPES
ncbi:hypothetical protein SISNIDRAFT_488043 [Sistotremastrum niveocremeum HHB9708]|uniref:F-box domain-containing protein n=1 Tax=Sistotremastrum niveocremeum HHB9708 TaxID=1314777 RepID=A0A164RP51_9AGAM|nr:hypothetical protein SISNIDRAFT_488043 [Sistotremastrum niveocremeum HHB9708]